MDNRGVGVSKDKSRRVRLVYPGIHHPLLTPGQLMKSRNVFIPLCLVIFLSMHLSWISSIFLFIVTGRSGCFRLVALMVTMSVVTSADRKTSSRNRLDTHHNDAASSILMNNLLLELDESLPECSAAFRRVQSGERSAHASYPPDIKGLWVSQE
jgi:hypothetical protein